MEQSLNDLEEYYDFSNLKLTGKEALDNKTMYKISFTGYDSLQVYAILVLKNSSNSIEDDRYPYYQVYYPDDETAAVIEEDAFKKLMDNYKKSLIKK
jgi:archaellin